MVKQQMIVLTILSTQTVFTTWIKIQNTTVQKEVKPLILFMLNGGLIERKEIMMRKLSDDSLAVWKSKRIVISIMEEYGDRVLINV